MEVFVHFFQKVAGVGSAHKKWVVGRAHEKQCGQRPQPPEDCYYYYCRILIFHTGNLDFSTLDIFSEYLF